MPVTLNGSVEIVAENGPGSAETLGGWVQIESASHAYCTVIRTDRDVNPPVRMDLANTTRS